MSGMLSSAARTSMEPCACRSHAHLYTNTCNEAQSTVRLRSGMLRATVYIFCIAAAVLDAIQSCAGGVAAVQPPARSNLDGRLMPPRLSSWAGPARSY